MTSVLGYVAIITAVASALRSQTGSCNTSDNALLLARYVVCKGMNSSSTDAYCSGTPANVTGPTDWPGQAVAFTNVLRLLVNESTCLNTTVAVQTVAWVNSSGAEQTSPPGGFGYSFGFVQPTYFDMPYKPGARVEAPDTLGNKCWASAYLSANWDGGVALSTALQPHDLNVDHFITAYDTMALTAMSLCNKVIANCFVNASYDPARNGTCAGDVLLFKFGFEVENIKYISNVAYPFYG